MPSLYVHVPFCVRKCAYCDFESHTPLCGEIDLYIDRVLSEARAARASYGAFGVPTLYFGGGTPSLLEPERLERLIGGITELFPPDAGAEITAEANPGTLTYQKLDTLKRLGINRLSLGVQATQDRLLKTLGRVHDFSAAEEAIFMARSAGFDNISCDLMFALPGQTGQDLIESIDKIALMGPRHISCYSLIPEEGTPLGDGILSGNVAAPGEEEARSMQFTAVAELKKLGYERYEISNYALPGFESRHNTVYWTGGDYLGLGCAAHSFMNGERFANPGFIDYMQGKTHTESETVDKTGQLEEAIMLQTRLARGLDLKEFTARFGDETLGKVLKEARRMSGYVNVTDEYLSLTEEGFMVHSSIVLRLIEKAEE